MHKFKILSAANPELSDVTAVIQFPIQSFDPISCNGKPVKSLIFKTDFTSPRHWFPVVTDRLARLGRKADRGL